MAPMPITPVSVAPVSSATPFVTLNGERWQKLGEYPRVVADSLRQMLAGEQTNSALLTPWGWVFQTCAIELHTGIYSGDVGLYVPSQQWPSAAALFESLDLPIATPAVAEQVVAPDQPSPALGRLRRFFG
jgi:hypothetical protein